MHGYIYRIYIALMVAMLTLETIDDFTGRASAFDIFMSVVGCLAISGAMFYSLRWTLLRREFWVGAFLLTVGAYGYKITHHFLSAMQSDSAPFSIAMAAAIWLSFFPVLLGAFCYAFRHSWGHQA